MQAETLLYAKEIENPYDYHGKNNFLKYDPPLINKLDIKQQEYDLGSVNQFLGILKLEILVNI